jgi:hypothetical protein
MVALDNDADAVDDDGDGGCVTVAPTEVSCSQLFTFVNGTTRYLFI